MWKDKAPPSAPTAATAFIRIEHFDHRSSRPAAAAHTAAGQNKRPLSDSFFFFFYFPFQHLKKENIQKTRWRPFLLLLDLPSADGITIFPLIS